MGSAWKALGHDVRRFARHPGVSLVLVFALVVVAPAIFLWVAYSPPLGVVWFVIVGVVALIGAHAA